MIQSISLTHVIETASVNKLKESRKYEAASMRKRIMTKTESPDVRNDIDWLHLDQIASIEVTSEDSSYPVENALLLNAESGWRAASRGEQTLRVIFDTPQRLKRIQLLFIEDKIERFQEFVLRWSPDDGKTFRDIVRQQWNFNTTGAAQETENYQVELEGVTQLELEIVPDKNGGNAHASLDQLRLA